MPMENRLQLWRLRKSPFNEIRVDALDNEIISVYASIALYEYKKSGYQHGNPLDNFLGIVGELSVRQCVRDEGIWHRYAERRLNYWGGKDQRKYDFLLKNGITLEIVAVRPYHKYCIIKESSWKRSSFAIAVQIKRLRCYTKLYYDGEYKWYALDAERRYPTEIVDSKKIDEISQGSDEPIGETRICGYGTLEEILSLQNGWLFGKAGEAEAPTTEFDGRYKELSKLYNINELWDRLR